MKRIMIILKSGLIATIVNTIFLKAASLLRIRTENGGLYKLLLKMGEHNSLPGFLLHSPQLPTLFHFFMGLVLSMIYGYFVQPLTTINGWLKGVYFAVMVWSINGLVILPLLNQGLFGYQLLSSFGIAWFFKANLLFGLILGATMDYLTKKSVLKKLERSYRLSSQPRNWLDLSLPTNNLSGDGIVRQTNNFLPK